MCLLTEKKTKKIDNQTLWNILFKVDTDQHKKGTIGSEWKGLKVGANHWRSESTES